jgi:hypothetical protein
MAANITLDELRSRAIRAGLKLSEEELQKLLPGVSRTRQQVAELREHVPDVAEPAGVFIAANIEKR